MLRKSRFLKHLFVTNFHVIDLDNLDKILSSFNKRDISCYYVKS